jgi:protocatechuate 3,4-dioxygenase beta subunit
MADKLIPTPSQTVGPFFHLGMARPEWADLTPGNPAGERIVIEGRVLDGDGAPVPDACVEVWQANAAGRYNHPDDRQTDKPLDPISAASAGSRPMPRGGSASPRSAPARCPGAAMPCRRRISMSRCSRAAC